MADVAPALPATEDTDTARAWDIRGWDIQVMPAIRLGVAVEAHPTDTESAATALAVTDPEAMDAAVVADCSDSDDR